jgi:hypothetical protein
MPSQLCAGLPRCNGLLTFFWLAKKNAYGSMPYQTVFPMMGNQWKTTGGSFGFLNNSCFRTLRTTARRIKEAKPAAYTTGRDEFAVKSPNGPAMVARTPILRDRGVKEDREGVREDSTEGGRCRNKMFPEVEAGARTTDLSFALPYRAVCQWILAGDSADLGPTALVPVKENIGPLTDDVI